MSDICHETPSWFSAITDIIQISGRLTCLPEIFLYFLIQTPWASVLLNGNTDILTSTFITLRAKLRSIAGGIAGADEADDVIHDAFCRLWARHQAVGSETDAARLTYTAVRNSAIDSYRRRPANP
ncbi:MAG: hypothetical protein K2G00_03800, partial [Duncaniella sp.]|nr:hypothetical protein [Duncaniella sp.]